MANVLIHCSGPTFQKPSQVRSFTANKVNFSLCFLTWSFTCNRHNIYMFFAFLTPLIWRCKGIFIQHNLLQQDTTVDNALWEARGFISLFTLLTWSGLLFLTVPIKILMSITNITGVAPDSFSFRHVKSNYRCRSKNTATLSLSFLPRHAGIHEVGTSSSKRSQTRNNFTFQWCNSSAVGISDSWTWIDYNSYLFCSAHCTQLSNLNLTQVAMVTTITCTILTYFILQILIPHSPISWYYCNHWWMNV